MKTVDTVHVLVVGLGAVPQVEISVYANRRDALRAALGRAYHPDDVPCEDHDEWAEALADKAPIEAMETAIESWNHRQSGGRWIDVQETAVLRGT